MFKSLFDDARVASHAHAEDLANYELASEAAFLDQVAHAQDALLAELLAAAPDLIRGAAAQGRTETSVLDFVGPAKYSPPTRFAAAYSITSGTCRASASRNWS